MAKTRTTQTRALPSPIHNPVGAQLHAVAAAHLQYFPTPRVLGFLP